MEALKREGKRRLLSFIHNAQAKIEQVKVEEKLKNYDSTVITNEPPQKVKRILFVITRMVRFHGGQTSVLRLGTELCEQGYQVAYAVYKPQSRQEMLLCAESNLGGFQGKLYTKMAFQTVMKEKKEIDIVVATSWDTVSYAKKVSGYKMYFVQDFEPYFYSFGELFLLAKKTYEQGLHMVSLGAWNRDMIKKNCKIISPIDVVDFPYEKKEYPEKIRDFLEYKNKETLILAVYLKFYGKRLPCILQKMMLELADYLKKDGIVLEVKYFGEAKSFKPKGGENLGMLDKNELLNLYNEADFGVVASMSNISLVPFEMLSAGLPIIEFEDGTFEYFFPQNSAVMTSISGYDLYLKLKKCMEQPEKLEMYQEHAKEYMEKLSWEKTGRQFGEIIENICGSKLNG